MNTYELFEKRFDVVTKSLYDGDYSEAPFPLTGDEAYCYLKGEMATLQWVLEMLPRDTK